MQTLTEIKALLAGLGAGPSRALGQNFLIDRNLMGKLLELADLSGTETVLEVGSATGSLTEELADRAGRVVAVELDRRLAPILAERMGGRENVTLVSGDVLASKHALSPAVLAELGGPAPVHLASNLPYNVAVPVIVNCLLSSWRTVAAAGRAAGAVRFDRLTFTVQRELAERLTDGVGGRHYGPAGVVAAVLARATVGRDIPPAAFWPRPKVQSRIVRLDFDAASASRLGDAGTLQAVLSATFGHRRKKLASAARSRGFPYPRETFLAALAQAGVDADCRPEQIAPQAFVAAANVLQDIP